MNKVVDIIIPIYKGHQETLACIKSVLKTKEENQTTLNIILIDDNSPEPELSKSLIEISQNENLTLLKNTDNLGFVKTVNIGMKQTDNDVILLNSDTEVCSNWVDKLVFHAGKPNIASVTPFSNNATICSYPVFCAKNPLPYGKTLKEIDAVCYQANKEKHIVIPTAVGFCMYINRHAIKEVGFFDEEAFGKGYGEENDFSVRADKKGLKNIQALDTFVMHEGGVSFQNTQVSLQKSASKALLKKHPDYNLRIQRFLDIDPGKTFRRRIDLLRIASSSKPLVLFVSHSFGGGTEKHIKDLANLFTDEVTVLKLAPFEEFGFKLSLPYEEEEFSLYFSKGDYDELLELLKAFNLDHIHYHYTLGFSISMLDLPQKLNLNYDVTLHDYHLICFNNHLNNKEGNYCGEPYINGEENNHHCHCYKLNHYSKKLDQSALFLKQASRIISPSWDTKSRFENYFKDIDITVIAHPEAEIDNNPSADYISSHNHKLTKVLLFGAISLLKGSQKLIDTVNLARKNEYPIEFHLLGYCDKTVKTSPNFKIYGHYEQAEVINIIKTINPDIIWFPSCAPETYCYTLSEAMQSGFPIAATRIGALPERLTGYSNYWLCPYDFDAENWLDFFSHYKEIPKEITPNEKITQALSYQEGYWIEKTSDKPLYPHLLKYAEYGRINEGKIPLKIKVLKKLVEFKQKNSSIVNRIIPLHLQQKVKNWLINQK